jgi:peptidoglycan endopeptidase LytE
LIAASSLAAATIAGTTIAEAAPATATITYTVREGDYLLGIARRFGVSLTTLLSANSLTATSAIHPGQQLVIPALATSPAVQQPAAQAGTITHRVVSGDYLSGIASTYRVRLSDLLTVNGFTASSVIIPGQVVTLPASAVAPSTPAAAGSSAQVAISPITHAVRSGDFLIGIASRYRVPVSQLLKANSLSLTSVIMPGQVLKLPAGAIAPPNGGGTISPPASVPVTAPVIAPVSGNATVDKVIAYAVAQIGKPYKFFTKGPATFDCSGLSLAAFAVVGITLPHYSGAQALLGSPVDWTTQQIRAGDLVFTARSSLPGVIGHLGIALDDGRWIHAPGNGDVVRIGAMPADAKILAVRRLIP